MRKFDAVWTKSTLKNRLRGNVVVFEDSTQAQFNRNGTYVLRRNPEDEFGKTGKYRFEDNGMVCVKFDKGGSRCDTFVRSFKHTFMLTRGGGRKKIKGIGRPES